jgi:hypothetical protein
MSKAIKVPLSARGRRKNRLTEINYENFESVLSFFNLFRKVTNKTEVMYKLFEINDNRVWKLISLEKNLPNNFILKYFDKLDKKLVIENSTLSDDTILLILNKINENEFINIIKYQNLSRNILDEILFLKPFHKTEGYSYWHGDIWSTMAYCQINLDEDFILENIERFTLSEYTFMAILKNQKNLSLDFLVKYVNEENRSYLFRNKNISKKTLENYKNYLELIK